MSFTEELQSFMGSHPFKNMEIEGKVFQYLLCGNENSSCTLCYFVGGTGNPLGWYRHVLSMEENYRILLVDYPMGEDRVEPMTALIGALIERLHIDKAVWIGASFGGYMAQLMARTYADKTEALVLYATTALTEKGIGDLQKQYHYVGFLLWLMEHFPYGILKALTMKPMMKRLIPKGDSQQDACLRGFIQWIYEGYTREMDLHMTRLRADLVNLRPVTEQQLSYLKGRVLLILPEQDRAFTEEMQQGLISLMQDPLVLSAEGGHLATLTHAEEFAEKTRCFLQNIGL